MRYSLVGLLLCAFCLWYTPPVFAVISATSNVCSLSSASGDTTIWCTMPGNTTAGNFIAVCVMAENTTEANFQSVSDGTTSGTRRSTTWGTNDTEGSVIFDIQNITGLTTPTITVTFAGSYTFRSIIAQEYTDVATSDAFDKGNVAATDSGSSRSSGNVITTVTDELLFGCNANTNGNGTFTPGASWSEVREETNAGVLQAQQRIVSSTGTYDSPSTISISTDHSVQGIATYKQAGAGGGGGGGRRFYRLELP